MNSGILMPEFINYTDFGGIDKEMFGYNGRLNTAPGYCTI